MKAKILLLWCFSYNSIFFKVIKRNTIDSFQIVKPKSRFCPQGIKPYIADYQGFMFSINSAGVTPCGH